MRPDSQLLAWVATEVQAMQQPGKFGTVIVRIQDGVVTLVEVNEQKKPPVDGMTKTA